MRQKTRRTLVGLASVAATVALLNTTSSAANADSWVDATPVVSFTMSNDLGFEFPTSWRAGNITLKGAAEIPERGRSPAAAATTANRENEFSPHSQHSNTLWVSRSRSNSATGSLGHPPSKTNSMHGGVGNSRPAPACLFKVKGEDVILSRVKPNSGM